MTAIDLSAAYIIALCKSHGLLIDDGPEAEVALETVIQDHIEIYGEQTTDTLIRLQISKEMLESKKGKSK